jgi:hypothetical protein
MHDYVIAVGGTGARCLEAICHFAAAGLFPNDMHFLVLDPDQNNGNGKRTQQLIRQYSALQRCDQPAAPTSSALLGLRRKELEPPSLFRVAVNASAKGGGAMIPYYWRNPNVPSRTFEQAVNFTSQPAPFQDFIRLFYQDSDLGMQLNAGYRGRTSVGAVALKIDLDSTLNDEGGGLCEIVRRLQADLQNGRPRVFVIGSVFGGTGAAALPTVRAFLQNLDPDVIGPNASQIEFGCGMLVPYFTFPKSAQPTTSEVTPDSDEHMIATKAALLHYSQDPPGYRHVYLIGAPERVRTSATFAPGDETQVNTPHYVELVTALAASDFFREATRGDGVEDLHFANDVAVGDDQARISEGITWRSLPTSGQRHQETKRKLVSFVTTLYFYKNFLHRTLTNSSEYLNAPWYRDNFRPPLTLASQRDALNTLFDFSTSFLTWLRGVGESGGTAMGTIFRWEGLLVNEISLCTEYLGHLTEAETGSPRFMTDSYHQILKRMDSLVLERAGAVNPVGLLIYLLYHAVDLFCAENYKWQRVTHGPEKME